MWVSLIEPDLEREREREREREKERERVTDYFVIVDLSYHKSRRIGISLFPFLNIFRAFLFRS